MNSKHQDQKIKETPKIYQRNKSDSTKDQRKHHRSKVQRNRSDSTKDQRKPPKILKKQDQEMEKQILEYD